MEDLCSGCLCSGRKLRLIVDTDFSLLYYQILNEISVQTTQICIKICWECSALLKKFELFKAQVKRNYTDLLWNIPPTSQPSHLTTTNIYNLSYPDLTYHQPIQLNNVVKEEADDIKTEEEPVMFVNDLPLADDNDDEPIKKSKKKTKAKKPSKTKVKVKKKNAINKSLTPTKAQEPETQVPESQQLLESQQLPEPQQLPALPDNPDTQQLPETDDGVSDREMIDSFQDEDDKPLKDMKLNEGEEVKENSTNGVTKPIKAKAAVPRSKIELLPDKPQCVECGKTFSSRKTYRYHLNVLHKGNNQYPCPRCGKIYQWKSNLGRHMRTHKAVDDGELYCEQCDKSFASVATYRQHLRISRRHVSENEFSFTCNECGKKFVNKTRLRDHVDWEHLKKIKFRCQLCNKPFKCHTSLYVHLQNVHRNKEKKDNLCHVCGKSYQNAAKLKYHIIALHTGETPYQCSQCSAAFGWYSSLYRHIREVHYKVKSQPKKSKKAKKLEMEPPPYMNY